MLLFVPHTDNGLGMFAVVDEPLRDALDALNSGVQVLQLFLDSCHWESAASTTATAAATHVLNRPSTYAHVHLKLTSSTLQNYFVSDNLEALLWRESYFE